MTTVSYRLKTPGKNVTADIVFGQLEFVARLAVLVPAPRVNLIRFHGLTAPAEGSFKISMSASQWGSYVRALSATARPPSAQTRQLYPRNGFPEREDQFGPRFTALF